jgi:hypothetical protein
MSTLIPIQYRQGEPVIGDLMAWNGRKFVPVNNVYYTQFHWCIENANSGSGIGTSPKLYPLGIIYLPPGESLTLVSISARTDIASQTIKILKRAFGSTTLVYLSPASPFSFQTVSTTGSVLTADLPVALETGDELFVQFGTNAFSYMSISVNLKHKK